MPVKMRRAGHAHDGDVVGEAGIGLDVAFGDVQEIDEAAVLQDLRDADAVVAIIAEGRQLIGDVTDAEDEVRTNTVTHRLQHLERESHAVLERAAIFIVEVVAHRRPEL